METSKTVLSFHCSKLFVAIYTCNIRTVSRDFWGTSIFKMEIFPYGHRGCLWVRKF